MSEASGAGCVREVAIGVAGVGTLTEPGVACGAAAAVGARTTAPVGVDVGGG